MRVGVDSYSFHRFFGELRSGESDPGVRWTTAEFIQVITELGVDGVSLETCFLDPNDLVWNRSKDFEDFEDFEIVIAWGHPDGLRMGLSESAVADLRSTMDRASLAGYSLIRIVLGTYSHWGVEPPSTVLERLSPILAGLCSEAEDLNLELAIETHCDLPTSSLIDLVELINSSALGVVLDTANVVRIGEDLISATKRLNPYVRMVHAKDLNLSQASHGDPGGWWPTPSLGKGDLDLESAFGDLISSGFDGLACVELGSIPKGCDEIELVRQGVQWLRDLSARV